MPKAPQRVYVGMSGGVDSSVAALLLKEQGYAVTGIYMKNWSEDLPGMRCPWAEDLADAKRIAVRLNIPFEVWDFEADYRKKVVDYMLGEFKKGRTPNPDIMCNQEIKFKLFYERAMQNGADYIATGHYARNINGRLGRAADENKDQTYFLYRISDEAMAHTLFPLGEMLKPAVKKLAEARGLHNAYKKESMGVCFVGEVGMRDFLGQYIETAPGEIREAETDKVLGSHEGAILYTIGQRHGLYLSGVAGEANTGLPYYVVAKDLARNIIYVSRDLNYPALWTDELSLGNVIWRGKPQTEVLVRLRHRGELIPAQVITHETSKANKAEQIAADHLTATVKFAKKIKRPATGQSAVFYDDRFCLGGGIITDER